MDILTTLAVTLMLVVFNAVVIWFFVKYWDVLEPYFALSFRALKKQMDEEIRKEKLIEGLKAGEIKRDVG